MTLKEGVWHLGRRVWNLVEPMIEHGLISVLVACIMFVVSRLVESLASDERGGDIRAIESFCYSLVVLLYALHAGGVLFIRITKIVMEEVRRPHSAALAALPLDSDRSPGGERIADPEMKQTATPRDKRHRRPR